MARKLKKLFKHTRPIVETLDKMIDKKLWAIFNWSFRMIVKRDCRKLIVAGRRYERTLQKGEEK